MNKWFNMDSPFMVFLSRAMDLVILSLLWFVCCLPVFTIGPATAAVYHVTLKLAREEEIKIAGGFFAGFKQNFKQGVVMNLIFLALGVVVYLDYMWWGSFKGTAAMICSVCFLVMGIWMLCVMFYAYPLQAQFINPVRKTLKNAMILSTQKLGNTVIVFALNMLPVIVAFFSFEIFVRVAPVWVLVTPGVSAYLCAKRFVKIFEPYILPAESETNPKNEE